MRYSTYINKKYTVFFHPESVARWRIEERLAANVE